MEVGDAGGTLTPVNRVAAGCLITRATASLSFTTARIWGDRRDSHPLRDGHSVECYSYTTATIRNLVLVAKCISMEIGSPGGRCTHIYRIKSPVHF